MITADTRLSKALDAHPDMLEVIVDLNPHDFSRLRSARMRRFMAPRITLGRVAKMAGVPVESLLARIGCLLKEEIGTSGEERLPESPKLPPLWMEETNELAIMWVDVTPMDDSDDDPLPSIMAAWKRLSSGGALGIKHRWEPQPLYDVWEKLGLEYWSEHHAPDLWHIFVHRPDIKRENMEK